MLSPEGRCKTLDAGADGYVRAEACGALMLHLLRRSDVRSASGGGSGGRGFLALLVGTAVNQDGRSSSLTAPNGPAQQAVLAAALAGFGGPQHAGDAGPGGPRYDLTALQMHGTGAGTMRARQGPDFWLQGRAAQRWLHRCAAVQALQALHVLRFPQGGPYTGVEANIFAVHCTFTHAS
jgi:hypothetical protein